MIEQYLDRVVIYLLGYITTFIWSLTHNKANIGHHWFTILVGSLVLALIWPILALWRVLND
jgi:hypothetical protein